MVEVEIFEIKKTNKKAPDARDLLLENNRLEKEMLYLKKKSFYSGGNETQSQYNCLTCGENQKVIKIQPQHPCSSERQDLWIDSQIRLILLCATKL